MEPIPLTAAQIRFADEISADLEGTRRTLDVAMTFHSNRINEIQKQSTALWEELAELYGLDLGKWIYDVRYSNGQLCVVQTGEIGK